MGPKLVKGQLGWAAVGDGFMVYAKTRKEALRRYAAALESSRQPLPGDESGEDRYVEDVSEDVRQTSE